MPRLPRLPALLAAALLASSCGSAEVRSSASPPPTAAVPPEPAGAVPGDGAAPADGAALAEGAPSTRQAGCSGPAPEATNAAWEQRVIELVNRERKANSLPPLRQVASLTDVARWYAKDMLDDDYFGPGHDTYDRVSGRLVKSCGWSARIGAFYPGASALAENIGEGYASPEEVVAGWMGSSGHRANILSASYWETGVGYQAGALEEGQRWVQDFGRRRGIYPVVIDGEAAGTDSLLVSLFVYGRWTDVRIRNDDGEFSPWRPFTSTPSWSLADVDGLRTVSVEMRRGSTVVAASDTIELRLNRR